MICTNVTEYLQGDFQWNEEVHCYNSSDEYLQENDPILFTGEGVRLADLYPDDFQSYLARWVTYWPHSADPGYHRRLSYQSGFIKPRRAALGGPFLIEAVERHLNYDTWAEWRYHQGRPAR